MFKQERPKQKIEIIIQLNRFLNKLNIRQPVLERF
jgi:hypothetical protein